MRVRLLPLPVTLFLAACANEAPTAPVVGIGPTDARTDDDLVATLRAGSSDAEEDPVTYGYAWFVDGLARTDLSGDTVPAAETSKGEVWEVTVTPNDGEQDGPAGSASITILNTAPEATLTLSASAPTTDEDLIVTAAGTDADGDTVTFTYAWNLDGAPTALVGDTVAADATTHGERWAVTVVPNDGEEDGLPTTTEAVIANSAPVVLSVELVPDSPYVTDDLVAVVEASDADADPIAFTYRWFVDGAEVQAGDSDTLSAGAFAKYQRISVEVVPNDGAEDGEPFVSADAVALNSLPTATGASIDPATAYEATTLTCVPAGFADADADTAGWTYSWSVNGAPVATTATLGGTLFDKGDTVACTATPFDGEESGAAVTSPALTISNTAPVLASATLSTTTPTENDTISVTLGTVNDDDGDSVSYTYDWYVNGSVVSTSSTLLPNRFAKGDSIYVVVTPWDGAELGAPITSAVATGTNTPPEVLSASLVPEQPYVTDDVLAVVASSDVDGDAVTYTYTWFVDGVEVQSGASDTLAAGTFSKYQRIRVEVVPNDGAADGEALMSVVAEALNSVPTATGASIAPATASEASTLSCAPAGFADADADAEGWTYAWSVNGASVSTTSTLDGTLFDKGDTVACTATPFDGEEYGTSVTSPALTISNTAPVLASATLSTTTPTENDTISVTLGTVNDDDGDTVNYTYDWYVNGRVVSTSSTLLPNRFAKGDRLYVVVTPWDDTTFGAPVTSAVATGTNTPPTVTRVRLSPSDVYTDDTLTASVTATDLDGDTLSYTYDWYVDGVPRGSVSSSTLDGDRYFEKSQNVYVVITPNDGESDGTTGTSATITVLNSAPTAPVVDISPTAPEAGDDLTCAVVTASTDVDGDDVTYTFAWEVDGTAFRGATAGAESSTVDGSVVDEGEEWVCEVVADDGETSLSVDVSVGICVAGTEEICPAPSCEAVLSTWPSAPSGTYWIENDAGSAEQTACDMSTDGGGWTAVFLAETTDYASTSIDYTLDAAGLLADATHVLMGFVDASGAGTTDWATFPIPSDWKTASPMSYTSSSASVSATFDDGTTATRTLYYGFWNFYGNCGYWQSPSVAVTQGRVGFCDAGGPLFTSFSYDGVSDACNAWSGSWVGTACTSNRRFAIFVR